MEGGSEQEFRGLARRMSTSNSKSRRTSTEQSSPRAVSKNSNKCLFAPSSESPTSSSLQSPSPPRPAPIVDEDQKNMRHAMTQPFSAKVAVVPSAAALMINARNEPERDSKKVENIKAQEDVIEPCQDHGTQVDGEGAGRQCGDFGHWSANESGLFLQRAKGESGVGDKKG